MPDLTATIATIREAAAKATPRPWRVTDEPPCETYGVEVTIAAGADDVVVSTLWHEDMALAMRPDDCDLIVLAANHITALCDEIERLRAIVEPLETLLRRNNHVQVECTAGTADEWEVAVEQRWHVIGCHRAPTLADALRAACEAMGEG